MCAVGGAEGGRLVVGERCGRRLRCGRMCGREYPETGSCAAKGEDCVDEQTRGVSPREVESCCSSTRNMTCLGSSSLPKAALAGMDGDGDLRTRPRRQGGWADGG